ncbi:MULTISPECIES: PfkB family carbohydrate kinase [Microbacterium]|uniref:PfkB family carbohydrate kinase n=1 Tax=Microbacterium TaxID=33882 RepID=UPI00300FF486
MTGRVIHTGQAIVDLVLTVPALPSAGGDVFATSHEITAGGGFNVMAAARRDGAAVVYPGGHGTGRFGDIVREAMSAEGVEVTQEPTTDLDTGFSVAIVDDDAERTFVSTLGAEGRLSRADLDAVATTGADVVYLSGYSLFHEGNGRVLLEWLPTLPEDTSVVVDPSPLVGEIPEERLRAVAARASIWTANESEARTLAVRLGQPAPSSTVPELAHALARRLDATVIVRANRDGAVVAGVGREPLLVPPHPVEAIDTNGAGDAHTGVLCAGLATGRRLEEAVRRANVAAAVAVTRRGPATSPTSAEIDALL